MANDEFNKLKKQVEELQAKVDNLTAANNIPFKGSLDDVQVERVFIADTTGGTPPAPTVSGVYTGNSLLYQQALTGLVQDIKVLNFPERVMVYTWKGQRLAIPVYDITTLILP